MLVKRKKINQFEMIIDMLKHKKCIRIHGPVGTGKTLLAKWLASEAKLEYIVYQCTNRISTENEGFKSILSSDKVLILDDAQSLGPITSGDVQYFRRNLPTIYICHTGMFSAASFVFAYPLEWDRDEFYMWSNTVIKTKEFEEEFEITHKACEAMIKTFNEENKE